MNINFEKNTITIFSKSERFDVFVNRLAGLKGEQIYGFFANRSVAIPRRINCMALMSVLNERLKTIHASELSANQFQRLEYYKDFSETQLYQLFVQLCNTKEEFKQYRLNLFRLILINYQEMQLTDGEMSYIKNLKRQTVEKFENYFKYIDGCCQEMKGTFDGQEIAALEELLVKSATVDEINELAGKYGITLPQSLKKTELLGFIKEYLTVNHGGVGVELEEELDKMKVVELNAFCKKNRIPMSSNMGKNEQVFYLFYYLSQCEIMTTPIETIQADEMYFPLEFTIDFTMLAGFQRDDKRRILHYEGEENDEFPLMEKDQMLEEIEMIEADNNIEKPNYLESDENNEENVIYEYVDEFGNPVPAPEEGVEYVEEATEETQVFEEPSDPTLQKEVDALISQNFKEEEKKPAVKEEPKEEVPKGALPMNDIRNNTLFQNKKIEKLGESKAGLFIGIGATVASIVLLALLIYFLR